jgi:hypothetical protein
MQVAEGFACDLCKKYHAADVAATRRIVHSNPRLCAMMGLDPVVVSTSDVCEEHYAQALEASRNGQGTVIHRETAV